jgi:spore germination protein YaaH
MRLPKVFRVLVVATLIAVMLVVSIGPITAGASGCPGFYRVCPGDNLTRIAMRFGTTVWSIARANGITNPNRIFVGQVLQIPCAATPCLTCPPQPCVGCGRIHVVCFGETLSGIAFRYGTTVRAVAVANGIYNVNCIFAGQRLVIP